MNALMLTTDLELKLKLQKLCAAMSPPITLVRDMPGMLRLDPVAMTLPDLVFFDGRGEQGEVVASLERISARYQESMIVLMVPEQSPDLLIAAMRIGVREVVRFPLDFSELEMAIERIIQKRSEKVREEGKVLSHSAFE